MSRKRKNRDQDGLYQRTDSPFWWASYIDASGSRARRSTSTTNRKEAEAILASWRVESFQGRTWGVQPEKEFDEVLLKYLAARKVSPKVRSAARQLVASLSGSSATGATVLEVRQFIRGQQQQGRAPGTINKQLGLWCAAINFCNREHGMQLPNPVVGQKLKEPEGLVRWITQQEAGRLIDAAKANTEYLADVIAFALHTGMRRGELLSLEWSHVDLSARLVHLQAENTKSMRSRTIPFSDDIARVLGSRLDYRAEHCQGSKWVFCDRNGNRFFDIKKSFKTALKLAGIADFRFHDLRHTFAAWLVTSGVPLIEVRDLLGHSTIKMTERYAHLAPENLRVAVGRLPSLSHDLVTLDRSQKRLKAVSS